MPYKLDDILSIPASAATGGFAETIQTNTTEQDSATFVSMKNYTKVLYLFIVAAYDYSSGGGANTLTFTPLQGTTTAGAGAKAIGSTTLTRTSVGVSVLAVNAEELDRDGGFDCIGSRIDSDGNDDHRVLVIPIRGGASYEADTMPS